MIRALQRYFASIPPVFLDGCLYVMMAVTAVNAAMLASDNAAKFIAPFWLFVGLWINGAIDAALLALKMYRSTSFADHKQEKRETQFFLKSQNNPSPPKP